MKCLHNKEAGSSTTKNGTFWFCTQPNVCHFLCTEAEKELYENGVNKFLSLNKEQPHCHCGELAKMFLVKDPTKETYKRPFFTCSGYGCKYFEWVKDLAIPKPFCEHGVECDLFRVKKEGWNKGRAFFKCPKNEKCGAFIWYDPREEPENALIVYEEPENAMHVREPSPETHAKTKGPYTKTPKSKAIPIPKSRKMYDVTTVTDAIPRPLLTHSPTIHSPPRFTYHEEKTESEGGSDSDPGDVSRTHAKTKETHTKNPKDRGRPRSGATPPPGSKSRKIYDAIAATHTIPGPLSDPAKEVVRGLTRLAEDASDSDSGDVKCSQFFPKRYRPYRERDYISTLI